MSVSDANLDKEEKLLLDELIAQEAADNDETKSEDESDASEYSETTIGTKKRKLVDGSIKSLKEERLIHEVFGNRKQLKEKLQEAGGTPAVKLLKKDRVAVWHDSDDETAKTDDVIDYGKKGAPIVKKQHHYKSHLEKQFHSLLSAPKWADLDQQPEVDSDDELLQTVGHVVKPSGSKQLLQNQLQFKRMKDLNRATYAEGPGITSVQFHPSSTVAVVTGYSGIASIYAIDGKKNTKLHSMAFKDFPIKCCRISNSGTEALVGSSKKFFYSYNLMTDQTQRVFLPKTITKMTNFEMSSCGKYIAIIGRFGEVHLLDSSTKELICTFKQEHPSSSVAFSVDSLKLFSHSTDSEIHIFDIRNERMSHRFFDEGCVNGSYIAQSPSGRLLASGSEQGVVNVYDTEDIFKTNTPQPLKTVFNLTTAITAMQFNHTSEMLAIASKHIIDSVKLMHVTSGTIFSNFPGMQGNIGKPNILSFSPQSGFFAIGNSSKEVTLYRLKHYNNY